MKHSTLLGIGLCLLAGNAGAAEEVSLSYRFSPFQGPPVYTMGQRLKTASRPAETLAKEPRYTGKPTYGTALLGKGGDTTFTFVLDQSGGKGNDLLYVDCNNNEDLTDDRPVRVMRRQGRQQFGPLPLLVEIDGRKQLYHASVEGWARVPTPEYWVKSLGYFTGSARFGEKTHPIALVDYNGNGLYSDPFREFYDTGAGDMVLVDVNGDGRYEQEGIIPKEALFCGKCIVVDGRFYELETRGDGSALRVSPANVKLAAIRSDYPRFALMLASEHGMIPIEGRDGEARVPPGRYRVMVWSIERQAGDGKWQVQGGSYGPEGGAPELTVGESGSEFKLSAPLLTKVNTTRNPGGTLDFQLELTTSSGERIGDISVNGRKPPEPTLRIVDDQGKEVAALKFHYG